MSLMPSCAWCGETLKRRPRVLMRYEGLPGKPEIGWHIECEDKDPCCIIPSGGNSINVLMVITARKGGLERVVSQIDGRRKYGVRTGVIP